MFWFVQLSDPHCGNGEGFDRLMLWQANYEPIINPVLTIISGDLADNQDFDKIKERWFCDPKLEDWTDYASSVALWFDPDQVLDGPGNHDSDDDPTYWWFRNYSVQGTAFGRTQNSVVKTFPFGGAYHFLMCDTSIPGQNCWTLHGELDSGETAFIETELETYNSCNLQFIFGHHPITGYGLNNLDPESGGDYLDAALNSHGASFYGFGHVHTYDPPAWNDDNYLHVIVNSLGKEDTDNLVIYAVDGDGLSIRSFDAFDLPFVMITAPVDRHLGGASADNPYDYDIPKQEYCIVRAIAFDESAVTMEFQVDSGGSWIAMDEIRDHVWQFDNWDTRSLTAGEHTLTVLCSGTAVRTDSITVNISATEPTWTPLPTATPTPTQTPSPTITSTIIPPDPTFTPSNTPSEPTITPTFTLTPSITPTGSPPPTVTSTPTDTPLMSPTPLATATSTSTEIPTGYPTDTPIPSNTPVPTIAPTFTLTPPPPTQNPTSTPTQTRTPMPTDTPNDCTQTGVSVWMPSHVFYPADACSTRVTVCNAEGYDLADYPLFVILDVYGMYFFAPSFSDFDYYIKIFPTGNTTVEVIPEFTWPEGCGSTSGILWISALTNPEITLLFGELGIWEFGWSE
ncbi:metallophosphoesterase [bacterium]|nr:metallophosphoesterase [candidate division CSSED10-310 bacterium]